MTSAYSNGQPGESKSSGLRLIVGSLLVILGFFVISSGSNSATARTPDSEDEESNKSPRGEQKESQKISRRARGIYKFCVSTFPAVLATFAILATTRESNFFFLFRDGSGVTDVMNWFWWAIIGGYVFTGLAILVIAARSAELESSDESTISALSGVLWGISLLLAAAFLTVFPGTESHPGVQAVLVLFSGLLSLAVTNNFFKLPA
ncbi:hypothetical protein EJK80_04500 [Corynebacterium phoceense]|uniref:Uncharacterized protein n=1 Tax=Corynebacterium phoceense TaxID=1686286 RepID=A0A540R7U4_9CORY|nr:hypothetical protein [Corynebacterium phoceense]TQE43815.1 hypothetical protein EJK80_04500 [Corynebacterium phoceense]